MQTLTLHFAVHERQLQRASPIQRVQKRTVAGEFHCLSTLSCLVRRPVYNVIHHRRGLHPTSHNRVMSGDSRHGISSMGKATSHVSTYLGVCNASQPRTCGLFEAAATATPAATAAVPRRGLGNRGHRCSERGMR